MMWVIREPSCNRGGIVAVLQGRHDQDPAAIGLSWWVENIIMLTGAPPIFQRDTGTVDLNGHQVIEKITNPCDVGYQRKIRQAVDMFAPTYSLLAGCTVNELLVQVLINNHGFIKVHHDDVDFNERLGLTL